MLQKIHFPYPKPNAHKLQPALNYKQVFTLANLELAFTKVFNNQGAAGRDGVSVHDFAKRLPEKLAKLLAELQSGIYQAQPCRVVSIPKKNGKMRLLAIPNVRDRVVQTAISQLLTPYFESHFERCSFGYRPGRSYLQAVDHIKMFRDQGYHYVLDADIRQYFDEINRPMLMAQLADYLPCPVLKQLIADSFDAMQVCQQQVLWGQEVGCGLPQGSPLSPVLANLYLDPLDEALLASGFKVIRYADDFVVLCKSMDATARALATTREVLTNLMLCFNEDKTRVTDFDSGFVFLGHYFIDQLAEPLNQQAGELSKPEWLWDAPAEQQLTPATSRLNEQTADNTEPAAEYGEQPTENLSDTLSYLQREIADMLQPVTLFDTAEAKQDLRLISKLRTLYISQQGAVVHKKGGKILVTAGEKTLTSIAINQLDSIMLCGAIHLTRAVLQHALTGGLNILFMTSQGSYLGQLHSVNTINPALFSSMLQSTATPLPIAIELVRAKVLNQLTVLKRAQRYQQQPLPGQDRVMLSITSLLQRTKNCDNLNQLRGIEGNCAKMYFSLFRKHFAPEWQFNQRNRQPPRDPINALLSLGYTLLFHNVCAFIHHRNMPLNLGYLHQSQLPNPALALDMMEPFRAPVVDATVLQLVQAGAITPADFVIEEQGCFLTATAKTRFIHALENRLQQKLEYRQLAIKTDYRRLMDLQILMLKQHIQQPAQPFSAFRIR